MSSNPSPVQRRARGILRAAQAKQIPLPELGSSSPSRLLPPSISREWFTPPAGCRAAHDGRRVPRPGVESALRPASQRWKSSPPWLRRPANATISGLLVFAGLSVVFEISGQRDHPSRRQPARLREQGDAQQGMDRPGCHAQPESWVQRNSPKLVSLAEKLVSWRALGKGAASVLVALTSLLVFVVLLLLEAPKLRAGPLMSAERAERYSRSVAKSAGRSPVTCSETSSPLSSPGSPLFVTLTSVCLSPALGALGRAR